MVPRVCQHWKKFKLAVLLTLVCLLTGLCNVLSDTPDDIDTSPHTALVLPADAAASLQMDMDDPYLIATVRELIVGPSTEPYRLQQPNTLYFAQNKQDILVERIFSKKTNGFFIEAGALDGEYLSNTLYLERNLNWTGLLVEPVPNSFDSLINKNRRAFKINSCLSPTNKSQPAQLKFPSEDMALARILWKKSKKKKTRVRPIKEANEIILVVCFPLWTIMKALKNPVVDYLSLDVEGTEMKILQTLPWDEVKFKVVAIETNHAPEGRAYIRRFMKQRGYNFYRKVGMDDFFYNQRYAKELNL